MSSTDVSSVCEDGSMVSSRSSNTCGCQSCQNARREQITSNRMRFDAESVMTEFYPGKDSPTASIRSENIYDLVDTLPRPSACSKDPAARLATSGRSPYPGWIPFWSASSSSSSNAIWSSSPSYRGRLSWKSCQTLDSYVAAIGVIGTILGVAGLIAYLILQVPQFREEIGPNYATIQSRSVNSIYNPSTLIYSVELSGITLIIMIGILVNSLLLYGVKNGGSSFLIPWLAFHVFFIAACLVALVLISCFAMPHIHRLFALIPALASVIFILAWVKVYQLFQRLRLAQMRLKCEIQESWYASVEQPSPIASHI